MQLSYTFFFALQPGQNALHTRFLQPPLTFLANNLPLCSHLSTKIITHLSCLYRFLQQPSKHPPLQTVSLQLLISHFTCSCKPLPGLSWHVPFLPYSTSAKTALQKTSHWHYLLIVNHLFTNLWNHFQFPIPTMLKLRVKFLQKRFCALELST